MNIDAIQSAMPASILGANARIDTAMSQSQRSFDSTLGGMLNKGGDLDDTRKAAEEFVSIAFVEPILRSLRESNQAAEPFAPTAAEKSFGPLLDAEISKKIVSHERYGLVDAVARQLREAGSAGKAGKAASKEIDTHA
jgi:Rod binding domain-containing protein